MVDGDDQGLLRRWARTRPSARSNGRLAARRWRSSTGWWCATSTRPRRPRSGTTRPRSRRRDAPEDIGTEVFFLPAAAHAEKDGTFTNTQRLLQWHDKAVEPPGDAARELWFFYHLGRRLKELYADSTDATDRPLRDLDLGLPDARRAHGEPTPRRCCARSTATRGRRASPLSGFTDAQGRRLHGLRLLDLLRRLRRRGEPGPRAASRGPEQTWVAPRAGAGPGRRTAASSTTAPRPTPRATRGRERKRYVWWDAEKGEWTGHDVPDFEPTKPPDYRPPDGRAAASDAHRRRRPVHHAGRRQGAGSSCRRPRTGRCRRTTSRGVAGREPRSTGQQGNPRGASCSTRPTTRYHRAAATRASRTCSPPTGSPSTTPRAA